MRGIFQPLTNHRREYVYFVKDTGGIIFTLQKNTGGIMSTLLKHSMCLREKLHVMQTQLLFLQMSLNVDWILHMHGQFWAVLCYAQPVNYGIRPLANIFWDCPIRILPVNKRLGNLGCIQFIVKSSLIYTKSCSFGEVGGTSPLQLSSLTHFAKI